MRVLLVEDDDGVRDLLERALRSQGYAVLTAATAEEAEAIADATPDVVDLLVCDVYLPGSSGLDLARRLSTRRAGLRMLLMSGDPSTEALVLDAVAPAAFISKPFRTGMFLATIRALLDR